MAARARLRRVLPRPDRRLRARARGCGGKPGAAHARPRPDEASRHPERRRARDSDPRRRRHPAAPPGLRRAGSGAQGSADSVHRVQLGARVPRPRDRDGARSSLRAEDANAVLGVPGLRPRVLGRHALAAHARGPAGSMRDVLRRLVAGELTEDDALAELRRVQLDELDGRARLDLGRYLRRGIPEVVLAPGKDPADAARLVVRMAEQRGQGLISRMGAAHRRALVEAAVAMRVVEYHSSARVMREGFTPEALEGRVGILTAGTSDAGVADEARMMVEACGLEARIEADLGVAGLHRFVGPLAAMLEWGVHVLIVAAGMDGVLPGLVAGLVDVPVIGLPVSTGYGRGGAGKGALTTMLQSCSTGLVVVNIDNGVGAGAAAALIAQRRRGRSTATTANTIAPTRSRPKTTAATQRERTAPPGAAKPSASAKTATSMATRSPGKPRRRRP